MENLLTAKRLRDLFIYDPETGVLIRRRNNKICNGLNTDGYVQIMIDGKMRYGHRLAWLYVYGYWPKQVDHINCRRSDNRIANLRESTQQQNCGNAPKHKDNKSGFKGVSLCKKRNKWVAQICIDGKQTYLGAFETPEIAHAIYCEKAKYVFGEFART